MNDTITYNRDLIGNIHDNKHRHQTSNDEP